MHKPEGFLQIFSLIIQQFTFYLNLLQLDLIISILWHQKRRLSQVTLEWLVVVRIEPTFFCFFSFFFAFNLIYHWAIRNQRCIYVMLLYKWCNKKFGINWWISQDDSETGIWTKEKIKKISECWRGHYIKGDVLCLTAISQSQCFITLIRWKIHITNN